jgi:hypothetical protein
MPISELVMVIVAFGTRAPDGSDTVPERDALELNDWAHKLGTATTPTMTTSSLIANFSNHTVFKGAPPPSFMLTAQEFLRDARSGKRFPNRIGVARRSLCPKDDLLVRA